MKKQNVGMLYTPIQVMKRSSHSDLKERIELHSMQEFFGDVLVPTEEVVEMRGGQKRKSERKFFPGYVLVQMDLTDDSLAFGERNPSCYGFYWW